jgi:hypothetical protein
MVPATFQLNRMLNGLIARLILQPMFSCRRVITAWLDAIAGI